VLLNKNNKINNPLADIPPEKLELMSGFLEGSEMVNNNKLVQKLKLLHEQTGTQHIRPDQIEALEKICKIETMMKKEIGAILENYDVINNKKYQ